MAEVITTAPGFKCAARPPSPNNTPSVCAAVTTSTCTASQAWASSATLVAMRAPAAATLAQALGLRSKPQVGTPRRNALSAAPRPIEPRPITPRVGVGFIVGCLGLGAG